ncbi:MAG: hypothetical protein AAF206_27360 [Bacteroidota bacterium]
MRSIKYYQIIFICCLTVLGLGGQQAMAQTETPSNVRINGLGRTIIENTALNGNVGDADTTTANNLLDGSFLLDLQVNARPNQNTEVQTILRLRNEFGGFFGAGMTIEVRELYARGVVADIFRYHVGDLDMKMSPFTFYQHDAEGVVNEAEIFKARRQVVDYEQFYQGDGKRRMQGGNFDLGLRAGSIFPEVNLNGFFTRVRGTDFFSLPTRFVAGGSAELITTDYGLLRGNYVNTYDAISIGNFDNGIRNPVMSVEAEVHLLKKDKLRLNFEGEICQSRIRETQETDAFDKEDSFAEGLFALALPENQVRFTLGFRDVGPDFFAMGAQSKRIDFDRDRRVFNRFGNDRRLRQPGLFDLNRDQGLYTFSLSDVLMPYDPRYSNTMPYGQATPNRRGLFFGAEYGVADSLIHARLDFAQMQEIRGQGTFELKSFTLAKLWGNINLHHLINREEVIALNLGLQVEQTSRDGSEIEQVDLQSTFFEAGVQVEIFKGLDFLAGGKFLSANGTEYVPDIVRFNEVRDFPGQLQVADNEQLLAAGLRYRFKSGVFLSLQAERFSFTNSDTPENNYQIDQLFILYEMKF